MVENDFPIGAPLLNISALEDQTMTSSELCLDQVKFIFETQTLTVKVVAETDEIELIQTETVPMLEMAPPEWGRSLIGKKLQTFWQCENAQGYQDQIIFAFGTLQPSVTFLAEGSVLKVFQSRPLSKEQLLSTPRQQIVR
ncbi:DUF6334 family protein [Leptolyngbya sp. AN03gr2]|uniref:DUF6334 family protein n=1 Tax=unclassified Leptolyngbya TaxID=2650499 RepID=UPI003D3134AE